MKFGGAAQTPVVDRSLAELYRAKLRTHEWWNSDMAVDAVSGFLAYTLDDEEQEPPAWLDGIEDLGAAARQIVATERYGFANGDLYVLGPKASTLLFSSGLGAIAPSPEEAEENEETEPICGQVVVLSRTGLTARHVLSWFIDEDHDAISVTEYDVSSEGWEPERFYICDLSDPTSMWAEEALVALQLVFFMMRFQADEWHSADMTTALRAGDIPEQVSSVVISVA